MTPIEVISRNILIAVFLLGMLSGATVSLIVSSIKESRRKEMEK